MRCISFTRWLLAVFAVICAAAAGLPGGAAAQNSYALGPGDVLSVEVLEDPSLNRNILVRPDGLVSFPLAGTIRAAGRSVESVQSDLISQLSPNFSNPPTVFVSLEQLAAEDEPQEVVPPTIAVYVMGEVATPGRLELEPGTTLLQAFAQMGGFSNFAATKRVQLRRRDPATGRETVYPLNYEAISQGRSGNGSIAMQDGDVILVPTRRLFE
ncbi:polysaccharide biosynthesis/export family protein [Palleronia aestuarii]|uniref:polysaccharide biosynthesis/export family protein n=1 Tax=Palleronia aestuarii TaxID=568105 RepID=UPI001F19C1BA|nr:polysaccharide biosynthesis/export family protein [Palleronia aestuarii]